MFGAGGAFGKNKVTDFGGAVPDANFDLVGELETEFAKNPARVDDGARAIGSGFVPNGRQTEHGPRIARAQRADDKIVNFGRVFEDDHVFALHAAVTEFGDGR